MAATIYERDNCIGDILLGAGGGGVTLRRIGMPSRGEYQYSSACFMLRKPG